jgi:hypothetical protein
MALLTAAIVQTAFARERLNEEAALKLLHETLKRDHVYTKRISLDCVTFSTEEETSAFFAFVLRENHTRACGGDPAVSPVVDRYRVQRATGKIEWLEPVDDEWQPYDPHRIGRH